MTSEFNISSYLKILREGFKEGTKNTAAFFVSSSILKDLKDQEIKDKIKKCVKKCVEQSANPSRLMKKTIEDIPSKDLKDIFKNYIEKIPIKETDDISKKIDGISNKIDKIIQSSDSIEAEFKEKIGELCKDKEYAELLSLAFKQSLLESNIDFSSSSSNENKNVNSLKKRSLSVIIEYFKDEKEKKLIRAKFNNISGKTGQYSVPDILWQKRTSRKNRALIPFENIKSSEITYEQLNTFENGITVEFVNNDFFDQDALDDSKQNKVFSKLKDKLGCDDNVSAIIVIRSDGDSSSNDQRKAFKRLKKYLKEQNLELEEQLIKRKTGNNEKFPGQKNNHWTGFIYFNTTGGQQDGEDSHKIYKIKPSQVQLFNPAIEYANESVSLDITLVLLYFALFSIEEKLRTDKWHESEFDLISYFKTRKYDNLTLDKYVSEHVSLNIVPQQLYDPIQVKPIKIKDFLLNDRSENSLDITHQSSVRKAKYFFDSGLDTLLTPARPDNLFWSKHLSNMMQQDYSLKEYFKNQRENIKQWDEYEVDKKL